MSLPSSIFAGGSTATIVPYNNKTYSVYNRARFPGDGFILGSIMDRVTPYPVTATSADQCARSCVDSPFCRQYVYDSSGNVCYRMNSAYEFNPANTAQYPISSVSSGYIMPTSGSWFVGAGWQENNFSITINPPNTDQPFWVNPTIQPPIVYKRTYADLAIVEGLSPNIVAYNWNSSNGSNNWIIPSTTLNPNKFYKAYFRYWAEGAHTYLVDPLIIPGAPSNITSSWVYNSSGGVDLKITWTNPNLSATATDAIRDSFAPKINIINSITSASVTNGLVALPNIENTDRSYSKFSTTITGLDRYVPYRIVMNVSYSTAGIGSVTSQNTTYLAPVFPVPIPNNISNTWGSSGCTFSCSNTVADTCFINIKDSNNATVLSDTPMTRATGSTTFSYTYALNPSASYTVSFKAAKTISEIVYTSPAVSSTTPLPPSSLVSSWKGANNSTPTPSTALTNLVIGWTKTAGVSSTVKILDENGQPITGQPDQNIPATSSTATFSGLTSTNNYRYSVSTYITSANGTVSSAPIIRSLNYTTPTTPPTPVITNLGSSRINISYSNARLEAAGTLSGPSIVQSSSECGQSCVSTNGCTQYVYESGGYCSLYTQGSRLNTSSTAQWNPSNRGSIANMFNSGYITTVNSPSNVSIVGEGLKMTVNYETPSNLADFLVANPDKINYSITYGPVTSTSLTPVIFSDTPAVEETQRTSYQLGNTKSIEYGTTYAVIVRTFVLDQNNNKVFSSPSTPKYHTTTPLPRPIPTTIRGIAGDGSVTIKFDENLTQIPRTVMQIYYDTRPIVIDSNGVSTSPSIDNILMTSSEQLVSGLVNGETYRFVMIIKNENGYAVSNTISVVPAASSVAPSRAVNISKPIPGDQKVTLTWSPVTNASGYLVYYDTSSSVNDKSPSRDVSGNSVEITGLTNDTTYYFIAYPYNSIGTGTAVSNKVSAIPLPGPPAIPAKVESTSSDKSGSISWESSKNAVEYDVYLGTSLPLTEKNRFTTTRNSCYKFKNLTNGTHYYAAVSSVNSFKQASAISAAVDIIPIAEVPSTPGNFSVASGSKTFTATWDTVENVDSYNFYYATSEDMNTSLVKINVSNGILTQDITPSTKYWAYVTAVNSEGQESVPSPLVSFAAETDIPLPDVVTDLKVVSGNGTAIVYWSSVPNAEKYIVFYSMDKTFATDVNSVNSTHTKVAIVGLAGSSVYYFSVAAVNGTGTGKNSEVVASEIQNTVVSSAPPGFIEKVKKLVGENKIISLVILLTIIGGIAYLVVRSRKAASQ